MWYNLQMITPEKLYDVEMLKIFYAGRYRAITARLRRAGYVCSPKREAYYHPSHWRPAERGIGDTWIFDEGFYAITPEARRFLKNDVTEYNLDA